MARRLLAGVVLAAGSYAGSVLYRRRGAARRPHVDLYYEDGSVASLAEGSPEAARLLPIARELLELVRP